MKKLISQICSISILATSLNVAPAFASTNRSDVIRNVLAEYTMKMETAEGSIKSISEAAIALRDHNVKAEELVEYVAAGMEPAEAMAYRSAVASRLAVADSENMPELLKDISNTMSKGSNYRGCTSQVQLVSWVMGITSASFLIAVSDVSGRKKSNENEIKKMRLEKTDLESDINILIGEGVKPESFLIASIKKDIAYLDEQIAQDQSEVEKYSAKVKNYSIVAGATGAVAAIGTLTCM